jgi:hypothetical protein
MRTQTTTKARRFQQAPALAVSLVALFAALSGAAAALPGTETVNSGDIKNESVKSIDLKDNQAVASSDVIDETLAGTDVADGTIAGADVQDESLGSADVANNSLTGSDINDGSVSAGDLGPSSVRAQEIGDGIHNHQDTVVVPGGTAQNSNYNFELVTASCAAGEELISGSGHWTGDAQGEELMLSEVILDHAAETVTVKGGNDFGVNRTLVATATCL